MGKYIDIRDRFGEDLTDNIKLGAIDGFEVLKQDVQILRELGKEFAEAAAHPDNKKHEDLWRSTNDLRMTKPPIFVDEICWNEADIDGELVLRCESDFAREIEEYLRQELYKWKHLRASMIITPYIECPMVVYDSGFGIEEKVETVSTDKSNNIVSRHFNILIENEEDIEKIKDPEVIYDRERTQQNFQILSEIFGGILDVRVVGAKGLWFTPWDYLIRVTGIEETMVNLILEPDFINALVARYVDAALVRMKKYNELGIWSSNNRNSRVGSGGYGYTNDLQKPGAASLCGTLSKELWGCGNAQIFSEVSPEMHWEFSLKHELRWIEQFGLSYYGCCEPLHNKLNILEKIPNLRKISMSPWANLDIAAEICKNRYVMSCKPSPAVFVYDSLDEAEVKATVKSILDKTKGCSIELVMKDISTVKYRPQKLWRWVELAQEAIDEYFG